MRLHMRVEAARARPQLSVRPQVSHTERRAPAPAPARDIRKVDREHSGFVTSVEQ